MLTHLAPPGRLDLKNTLSVPAGPPSPSLSTTSFMSSVSWMAEKTSSELIPMLKNAYSALKDKEKDLVLAAELGKSLLEHNLRLKSSYDSLLHSTTPPITPSSSTVPIQEEQESNDEESSMYFISSRGTREAMIEVLERKNVELQAKLDSATEEQQKLSISNTKKTRQLENEIGILKSNLDIAATKIQELQDMNERQRKIEEAPTVSKQDESLVDELYSEMDKMQLEREKVLQSKEELESKLSATLKDLGELRKQFEQFEFTQSNFDKLQEAYQRQFSHIDELNSSLEEHRIILQKLKERGISLHSARSTPAPSCYGGDADKHQFRNTLLGELESEWLKSTKTNSTADSEETKSSFMYQLKDFSNLTEKSMNAFYNVPSIGFESVLSKATGIDQDLLDDALEFINKIEQEHNQEKCMALYNSFEDNECDFGIFDEQYPSSDLYPCPLLKPEQMQIQRFVEEPKTFVGRLRNHIVKLFNLVWRWCRFAMVLTTALLISAWQGPDSLLITC